LVNSLNHLNVGYRNHNTKDFSNNHLFTGYLVAGEGWHNNHHNDPANPKFGEKWWEIDLGWWFIKLIRSR
jgi:stearoyl-CoA desaturase (delta-9 desaturase)